MLLIAADCAITALGLEQAALAAQDANGSVDPNKEDANGPVDPNKEDATGSVDPNKEDANGSVDPNKEDANGSVDPNKEDANGPVEAPDAGNDAANASQATHILALATEWRARRGAHGGLLWQALLAATPLAPSPHRWLRAVLAAARTASAAAGSSATARFEDQVLGWLWQLGAANLMAPLMDGGAHDGAYGEDEQQPPLKARAEVSAAILEVAGALLVGAGQEREDRRAAVWKSVELLRELLGEA